MNKKFQNIGNQTVVYNENEEYEKREYQDNIEEILIAENVLEKLNQKLVDVYQLTEDALMAKRILPIIYLGGIIITLFFGAVGYAITIYFSSSIISFLVLMFCVLYIAYDKGIKPEKNKIKEIDGYVNQIAFLEYAIEKQKRKIEELKNTKSQEENVSKEEYIVQKVKYKRALKSLKKLLLLNHYLGVEEKGYFIFENEPIKGYGEKLSSLEIEAILSRVMAKK